MPVALRVRSSLVVLLLSVAVIATAGLLMVRASSSDEIKPARPDIPYAISSQDQGYTVTLDAAGFSGFATLVSLRLLPPEDAGGNLLTARVAEDSFGPGSLVPVSSLGGLALPVADAPARAAPWRLSPASTASPVRIEFHAIDLTLRDRGVVRVSGDWSFDLEPPADLAARLRVEALVGASAATDSAITVRVQGAQRSTQETLITVVVESGSGAVQLDQPKLVFGDSRLAGAVKALDSAGTVLLLSFPPTPFGSSVRLEMGPFVSSDASAGGQTTLALRAAMQRQGIKAASGASGVVDPLTDIVAASGEEPPDILSFEFATSAQAGVGTSTVGVTVKGNYENSGMVRAFADGAALRGDWQTSSYRTDPNGVVTEGTTRAFFRTPDGVPELLVVSTGGKAAVIQGKWSIDIAPAEAGRRMN